MGGAEESTAYPGGMTCCVVVVVDELVRRDIIAVELSVYFYVVFIIGSSLLDTRGVRTDTIRLEVVKDLSMGKRE